MNEIISYTDVGKGPTVVLLHGFCESKAIWERFQQKLSQHFRVIIPDLPGFGDNPPFEGDTTIEEMADIVFRFLKKVNAERCTVIAHSLGGYIGLALAEKYTDHLNGLGLFHSTAYPDTPEKKEARTKAIDFLEKNGVESFIEGFVAPLFYVQNRRYLREEMAFVAEIGKKTPLTTAIALTKAMRDRRDRTHVLEKVPFPVMFIAGRDDNAVNFKSSKDQFLLPANSTIHVLAETAHMGMFEREEDTYRMCDAFVRRCFNL